MHGFTSLGNVVKKILYCNISGIYWKLQNISQSQNKGKQVSALIESKKSYLLKAGTASSHLLPIINLLTGWKHVFPEKHCDNIFIRALPYVEGPVFLVFFFSTEILISLLTFGQVTGKWGWEKSLLLIKCLCAQEGKDIPHCIFFFKKTTKQKNPQTKKNFLVFSTKEK